MTESNEKKVREIEKVDKTDAGSITNLDEAIAKLTENGKRLERESEALRGRLADFVGSEHVSLRAHPRAQGIGFGPRVLVGSENLSDGYTHHLRPTDDVL